MTCTLPRPDPQVLFNRYLKMFSATVLGGAEVIPESNEWYAVALNYAMAEEFATIADAAWKATDPSEVCCDDLVEMAARDGVYPRPAVPAQGFVKLTGTAGTTLPNPLEFAIGGLTFVTAATSSQPARLDDNGNAVIRVKATTPGAAGNLITSSGTLVGTINGVNRTVEVCGGTFCNGQDAEECEIFRDRYLRRLQFQPRATQAWLQDKLLEWPCLTRATIRGGSCCKCESCDGNECGCADCGGKMEFYTMFDNTFPCGVAPESVINEVQTWLFGSPQGYGLGQVEIGVCGRIIPVKTFQVIVRVDVMDCLTTATLQEIQDSLTEYFQTLTPSMPLLAQTLNAIVTTIVGIGTNLNVSFDFPTPTDVYGNSYGPRTDASKVFFDGCNLEPDCDYMPCLSSVVVISAGTTGVCL